MVRLRLSGTAIDEHLMGSIRAVDIRASPLFRLPMLVPLTDWALMLRGSSGRSQVQRRYVKHVLHKSPGSHIQSRLFPMLMSRGCASLTHGSWDQSTWSLIPNITH